MKKRVRSCKNINDLKNVTSESSLAQVSQILTGTQLETLFHPSWQTHLGSEFTSGPRLCSPPCPLLPA